MSRLLTLGVSLLFVFLCAALTASSAEIDFSAPGFWSKHYAIPGSYCASSITLEAPRVMRLVKASSPCKYRVRPGGVFSDCRLSEAEAERVVTELKRLGTMTAYSRNCAPRPENDELVYKRDNLRRESEEIGLTEAAFPGISRLMDAQLSTLDLLVFAHEAAFEAWLHIVIKSPEATPALGDAAAPARDENKATPYAAKVAAKSGRSWTRRSRVACEQVEVITVEYEKSDGPMGAERLKTIRRLGEPYLDPSCRPTNDPSVAAAILTVKPEKEFRRILMELPGLRSWRVALPAPPDGIIPDDRRFEILSADLAANAEVLRGAPHIRALAIAELERVRENAARLRRLRGGRLLLIKVER